MLITADPERYLPGTLAIQFCGQPSGFIVWKVRLFTGRTTSCRRDPLSSVLDVVSTFKWPLCIRRWKIYAGQRRRENREGREGNALFCRQAAIIMLDVKYSIRRFCAYLIFSAVVESSLFSVNRFVLAGNVN